MERGKTCHGAFLLPKVQGDSKPGVTLCQTAFPAIYGLGHLCYNNKDIKGGKVCVF